MRSVTKPIIISCLILILAVTSLAQAQKTVSIITKGNLQPPAKFGLKKLRQALEAKNLDVSSDSFTKAPLGFVIIAGIEKDNTSVPRKQESFAIRKTTIDQKPGLVLSGYDSVGLMYAALDTAQRISWAKNPDNPFEFVKETTEKPAVKQRSISIYSMQRAYFEQRLFDENYFEKYFDMLAENRFNHFVLVLGYHNMCYFEPLFTSPAYPYFFDVEQYPQVKFGGITSEDQKKHTLALKRIIKLAHDRGIKFGIGLWDHVVDHGNGVDTSIQYEPDEIPENFIVGINKENLNDYTRVAFAKFLKTFPGIDSLQLRLHWESGLKVDQTLELSRVLFEVIKEHRPDITVDIRAKDVPDEVYDDALKTGVKLRIATKYWMEQLGLPFHPTHVNPQNQHDRRHGYADLLKYPQQYKVHFRLWNGGTNRILLWADPEYVRRFCDSVKIYNGDSFEINEPLVLKMNGQNHEDKPFDLLNKPYQYYDYEFERYWHFYQTFGRVSYDPNCNPQIWEHQFAERFGPAGEPLMKSLHQASKILPRIVASSFPYSNFPTPKGWSEMKTFGSLPSFAKIQGSDVQQFLSPAKTAQSIIEGTSSPMRKPADSSRWFSEKSKAVLEYVTTAEKVTPNKSKEFISTVTDLKILAHLADFHSNRLMAAVNYNLFKQTGDLFSLDEAIEYETNALNAWKNIIGAADDVYNFHIKMGNEKAGLKQHWNQWLPSLEKSLADLKKQRTNYHPLAKEKLFFAHVPVRKLTENKLTVKATLNTTDKIKQLNLLVSNGSDFKKVPFNQAGKWRYIANFPSPDPKTDLKYSIQLETASGTTTYPSEKDQCITVFAGDSQPPAIQHDKILSAPAKKDLKIFAKVTDPSGIKWARLRYRHLTQFEDYKSLEMKLDTDSGRYSATIPGDFIIPKWDLMYFIEVMDNKHNGKMYPDLEKQTPYIIVELER